jgi:hypothetical protein
VIRKAGQTGLLEGVALVGALAIVASASRFGLQAAQSATGLRGGVSADTFYGLAAIASSFAAFDVKVIVRGGVSGARRISRHLWHLGFALFIATLSLFVGQPQVFPERLRESSVLVAPVVLVAALIVFWLLKVRFPMSIEGLFYGERSGARLGLRKASEGSRASRDTRFPEYQSRIGQENSCRF